MPRGFDFLRGKGFAPRQRGLRFLFTGVIDDLITKWAGAIGTHRCWCQIVRTRRAPRHGVESSTWVQRNSKDRKVIVANPGRLQSGAQLSSNASCAEKFDMRATSVDERTGELRDAFNLGVAHVVHLGRHRNAVSASRFSNGIELHNRRRHSSPETPLIGRFRRAELYEHSRTLTTSTITKSKCPQNEKAARAS